MEKLLSRLRRILGNRRRREPSAATLDKFSARDWADLPVYHPRRDV
jgi:hypothetical protein